MDEETKLSAIAKRRELRRKKILENTELRKQKIFGITGSTTNSNGLADPSPNDIKINDDTETSSVITEPDVALTEFDDRQSNASVSEANDSVSESDVAKLKDLLKFLPDPLNDSNLMQMLSSSDDNPNDEVGFASQHEPLLPHDSLDVSKLSNSNPIPLYSSSLISNQGESKNASQSSTFSRFFSHPFAPFYLALLVCVLWSVHLGGLFGHSLAIPFIIFEINRIMDRFIFCTVSKETSIYETAIILVGVKKEIVHKYFWIFKLLGELADDFSMYFVLIAAWHCVIGFPLLES